MEEQTKKKKKKGKKSGGSTPKTNSMANPSHVTLPSTSSSASPSRRRNKDSMVRDKNVDDIKSEISQKILQAKLKKLHRSLVKRQDSRDLMAVADLWKDVPLDKASDKEMRRPRRSTVRSQSPAVSVASTSAKRSSAMRRIPSDATSRTTSTSSPLSPVKGRVSLSRQTTGASTPSGTTVESSRSRSARGSMSLRTPGASRFVSPRNTGLTLTPITTGLTIDTSDKTTVLDSEIVAEYRDDISKNLMTPVPEDPTPRENETFLSRCLNLKSAKLSKVKRLSFENARKWSNAVRPRVEQSPGDEYDEETLNLMHAAAYIQDSQQSRYGYGLGALFYRRLLAKWCFKIRSSLVWRTFLRIVIALNMHIIWFESPSSSTEDPVRWTLYVDLACWIFFMMEFGLACIVYGGLRDFWKERVSHWIFSFVLLAQMIDIIANFATPTVRVTRLLTPLVYIVKNRSLKRVCLTIIRTIPHTSQIMYFFLFFLIMYSIMGVVLLRGMYDNFPNDGDMPNDRFDDLGYSSLSLFILTTTENYPDVMFPALWESRLYVLFFWSWFIMSALILSSLITAIIVTGYSKENKKLVLADHVRERKSLMAAYSLLDHDKRGYIDFALWSRLIAVLAPDETEEEIRFQFNQIDRSGDSKVDILEFFELCDVLRIKFAKKNKKEMDGNDKSFSRALSRHVTHATSIAFRKTHNARRNMRMFYKNTVTKVVVIVLLLLQGINMALYRPDMADNSKDIIMRIDAAFLLFFSIDLICRLFAYRPSLYLKRKGQMIGALFIVLSLVFEGLYLTAIGKDSEETWYRVYRCVAVGRMTMLADRLAVLRKAVLPVYHILVVAWDFGRLVLTVMWLYAFAGMELFAFRYKSEEPVPVGALPLSSFDDFPRSIATVVQLLTTSNWHDIMYTTIHATNRFAAIYFGSFYVIAVILTVNTMLAIAITAYEAFTHREEEIAALKEEAKQQQLNNTAASLRDHEDGEHHQHQNDLNSSSRAVTLDNLQGDSSEEDDLGESTIAEMNLDDSNVAVPHGDTPQHWSRRIVRLDTSNKRDIIQQLHHVAVGTAKEALQVLVDDDDDMVHPEDALAESRNSFPGGDSGTMMVNVLPGSPRMDDVTTTDTSSASPQQRGGRALRASESLARIRPMLRALSSPRSQDSVPAFSSPHTSRVQLLTGDARTEEGSLHPTGGEVATPSGTSAPPVGNTASENEATSETNGDEMDLAAPSRASQPLTSHGSGGDGVGGASHGSDSHLSPLVASREGRSNSILSSGTGDSRRGSRVQQMSGEEKQWEAERRQLEATIADLELRVGALQEDETYLRKRAQIALET